MNIAVFKIFAVLTFLAAFSHLGFADETAATNSNLANLSARSPVGTGDNVGITGFIVRGDSGDTKRIIVRGLGPSMQSNGVPGTRAVAGSGSRAS
jgi:hypothetical protein